MRVYYFVKKALAIICILLVMYLFVGFFFWNYVVVPVQVTEDSLPIIEAMKPLYDFFKPATDLYDAIYNAFLDSIGGSSSGK